MILYQLLGGADALPPSAVSRSCRQLGEALGQPVEVDLRLAGADAARLGDLARELASLPGSRLHCRPEQLPALGRAGVAGLRLECHVLASGWRQARELLDDSFRLDALTVYLESGAEVPAIDRKVSRVRFAFVPPTEAGEGSRLEDHRRLVPRLMQEIRALAERWTQVSFRGALPFCLFSDAEQGLLARECLPNEDYRSRALVLAWRSDGTVAPWAGRLRHLVREAEPGADLAGLNNFYRARHLAIRGHEAFSECRTCRLRQRESCTAWDDLAPPIPPRPAPGVWPSAALRTPGLRARPHPAAAVVEDGAGSWLLTLPADRTLDSLRLNASALRVWELLGNGRPADELVAELALQWGEAALGPLLGLLEQFQRSGLLIIEPQSEGPP